MSSIEFHEYVLNDLMENIEGISSRKMFGGYGFYKNGIIFGIIADETLYFKVDNTNRFLYEKYSSKPFVYQHKTKQVTMSYWEVPADVLDNKKLLAEWIDTSYRISLKTKTKKT